jgi:hypothetical protein
VLGGQVWITIRIEKVTWKEGSGACRLSCGGFVKSVHASIEVESKVLSVMTVAGKVEGKPKQKSRRV